MLIQIFVIQERTVGFLLDLPVRFIVSAVTLTYTMNLILQYPEK